MHACEQTDITEGDTVLVTGGGPIGQLVAEVAMAHGAADVVLERSGADKAIAQTTEAVKRGGTIVFVGIPLDASFPTDVVGLIGGKYDLKGSFVLAICIRRLSRRFRQDRSMSVAS